MIDTKGKICLLLPMLLITVSLFVVSTFGAVPELEAIVIGRGFVVVDGIRTSGRAVLDVDLQADMSVKFGFGDYEVIDTPPESWLYGWTITSVVEGTVTVITALPADVGDGTVPGPVPIRILIRKVDTLEEGRTVVAQGSDMATGNTLRFSGKVAEIEHFGV